MNFVYGNNEERLSMEYRIGGNLQYTRYYCDNYEREETPSSFKEWTYVFSPGGLAAVVYNNNGTENLYYVESDHLGSPIALTNSNNQNIVEEYSFDAWGRRRNPANWSDYNVNASNFILHRGFTFHEHIDEFNLINMNGRVYDPVLGRFIQPDNIVQDPGNISTFNRYSYVMNNPLKFIDPSGWSGEGGGGFYNHPYDAPHYGTSYIGNDYIYNTSAGVYDWNFDAFSLDFNANGTSAAVSAGFSTSGSSNFGTFGANGGPSSGGGASNGGISGGGLGSQGSIPLGNYGNLNYKFNFSSDYEKGIGGSSGPTIYLDFVPNANADIQYVNWVQTYSTNDNQVLGYDRPLQIDNIVDPFDDPSMKDKDYHHKPHFYYNDPKLSLESGSKGTNYFDDGPTRVDNQRGTVYMNFNTSLVVQTTSGFQRIITLKWGFSQPSNSKGYLSIPLQITQPSPFHSQIIEGLNIKR